MTIYSGIFNSVNGDRKYNAWWFAKYFATFIGNGVFPNPSTNLQVAAYQNMKVVVKPGSGWIDGYFIYSDGDHVLSLDVADGVLKRIDRVVMRLNHLTRKIEIVVKKGTFASSPVAPTLQRDTDAYELALADVLINNGATQITQSNITDQRLNKTVCGIVHGTVDQVDTTTIFNQYQEWFKEITGSVAGEVDAWQAVQKQEFLTWFESIKDILEGDVAGNLASRIASLEQIVGNHLDDVLSHTKWIETVGGTANTLTATIEGLTSYKNGLGVSFPAKSNSTAAMSLNINGLGAIPIKKANGTPFSNGIANGVYTVRYRDGAFILQGESEVEIGKQIITPSTTNQTILKGVHDGTGYVKGDASLIPSNIKKGTSIFGVQGAVNALGPGELYVYKFPYVYGIYDKNAYKKICGVIVAMGGTFRVRVYIAGIYNGDTTARIYVNGVPVGIERVMSGNSSGMLFTEDITIKDGDQIEIWGKIKYTSAFDSDVGGSVQSFELGITSNNFTSIW
ncbi:hypothetical protein ACQKEY_19810 [Lysinibacillus fusiformis]|uniref:hypothetical protein n=1 Tax=Lysinibacillus fusiformis TaxID=28031 RepID=UPI003CFDAA32